VGIQGLQGVTTQQLNLELGQGGRFVVFQYAISVIILTFKRESSVVYIPPGRNAIMAGLPYTLLTLVLGWWGFPWGPIQSIWALVVNLGGGRDVTAEVMAALSP
jgi:hypothetical protein